MVMVEDGRNRGRGREREKGRAQNHMDKVEASHERLPLAS